PFAGHPNIGTAFVLAREGADRGEAPLRHLIFEEVAGLVPIDLLWDDDVLVGAELTCPEPFSRRGHVGADEAAACLGLDRADIRTADHAPQVVSVGLPFLTVELASRDALRRARPGKAPHARGPPRAGGHPIYTHTPGPPPDAPAGAPRARTFTGPPAGEPPTRRG